MTVTLGMPPFQETVIAPVATAITAPAISSREPIFVEATCCTGAGRPAVARAATFWMLLFFFLLATAALLVGEG